jgi:spoIIIJ-associated protein
VFGLSARVVVVAAPKGRRAPVRHAESGDGERGERGGRDRGRNGRGGREGRRDDRGRDRDRDRDRGRDRDRDRDRGDRFGARREPAELRPQARLEEPSEVEEGASAGAEAEESVATASSALSPIGDYVRGVLERMALGPFQISESSEEELTVIALSGPAAVKLTEGDGRAADAMQLLASQAASREADEPRRVVIDVEGDLARREEHLSKLAERAADRALETGRSVAIDPMSPRDRRIIHVTLRDQERIATMSVGVGRYRQVVVVPEGAPEYDEARRQAQAPNSRQGGQED